MPSPSVVEDQSRLLEDALSVVQQQAHLMRKCLETLGKLMNALKCRYDTNISEDATYTQSISFMMLFFC